MNPIPENSITAIRGTLSRFVNGVSGGRAIDSQALTVTSIDDLRALVMSELETSSLRDHLDLINSKRQFTMACHVAADFVSSHPLEYQAIVAQLTIFFFHADDILSREPEILRLLHLNLLTGQKCGEPVLDWFTRELVPRLWTHFEPLVANMIVVACYDFLNGESIELLTENVKLHQASPDFPDWLRFKTGLSPMYALLAMARHSDSKLPSGGLDKYVQIIPDVIVFTNIVNDVISFYKEALLGEQGNYLDMRAQRDSTDVITALGTLADEGVCIYDRVMAALVDEPEYRANFETYAKGITHFHTSAPRYRLEELFGAKSQ